jgi:hypothetical protein
MKGLIYSLAIVAATAGLVSGLATKVTSEHSSDCPPCPIYLTEHSQGHCCGGPY